MKKPETVTDDKGNIYIIPGQMTREEAEVHFPNQPERLNPENDETYCVCEKLGMTPLHKIKDHHM